jgi:hypothetical protein
MHLVYLEFIAIAFLNFSTTIEFDAITLFVKWKDYYLMCLSLLLVPQQ